MSFPAANRGLITFSNTQTRDPREKTSAPPPPPPPPTKGGRKENERMKRGTASKTARRRRCPTERDKFDFIALLELMLEARTAFGGDGGGETLEERSERGTAPRNAVGRPIGGFPTAAGKQSRNRAGGGGGRRGKEVASRDNNDAEMHSRNGECQHSHKLT